MLLRALEIDHLPGVVADTPIRRWAIKGLGPGAVIDPAVESRPHRFVQDALERTKRPLLARTLVDVLNPPADIVPCGRVARIATQGQQPHYPRLEERKRPLAFLQRERLKSRSVSLDVIRFH